MKKSLLACGLLMLGSLAYSQVTVTTLTAGSGSFVGPTTIAEATWRNPMRMAFDANNNLIVVSRNNQSIMKLDFTNDQASLVAGVGSNNPDYVDSTDPLLARFNGPYGLALDPGGNIFVADRNNARIRKIEKLASGGYGAVTTFAGNGTQGSVDHDNKLQAQFNFLADIAINSVGDIFVIDAGGTGTAGFATGNSIRKISGSTGKVTTLVPSTTPNLSYLFGLAVDTDDNLIFTDRDQVFKVNVNTGAISVIAGQVDNRGNVDGTLSEATFDGVVGVTVHKATGDIYVSHLGNQLIRRIDRTNNKVTTIAGSTQGAAGPAGTVVDASAAQFATPTGLRFDPTGLLLYVGDTNNSTIRRIDLTSVLPVTLTSFTAKKQNNSVQLKWTTASERNNSHFEILRSSNGSDAVVIGTVSGSGNSNTVKSYKFIDPSPLAGDNYYRLRQVDLNGQSELSQFAVVKGDLKETALKIHASTASSPELKAFIYAAKAGKASLKITDVQGKILSEQDLALEEGSVTIGLSVKLQKQLYIATLKTGSETISVKFFPE